MKRFMKSAAVLVVIAVVGGCFHARIDTGLTPSQEVIKQGWAPSWIYGAVSPPTVQAASDCPNGVAQVHTYRSFLNMLVSGLTFGIFTPMAINVTCAQAGGDDEASAASEVRIDAGASMEEKVQQFQDAVDLSAKEGQPVLVRFE
jgi:hypothetical protein